MKKNINISYIYNFFTFFDITSAIWVIYLSFRGMNLIEIGFLEAIFHLTGIILEIPTGAIADIYGKKISLFIGRISSVVSAMLMIYSNTFWGFAVAFVFSAASYNLNSGASNSIIYDSLKFLGREKDYKKIYGNTSFFIEIASALAVLLGGILSDIRFIYAYILSIAIDIVALGSVLFFIEPPSETCENSEIDKKKDNVFMSQIKESFNVLKIRKNILYLIFFYAFISTMGSIVYFYSQKYFENMHYSRTEISIIFTINNLLAALFSKYAYAIERKLKMKKVIIIIPIINVIILSMLAVNTGYISILIFLLGSTVRGFAEPVFSDYINSLIPAKYRATILSFDSLCFSIFMVTIFPAVGFIGEKFGLANAFFIAALVFIPLTIFMVDKVKNNNKN